MSTPAWDSMLDINIQIAIVFLENYVKKALNRCPIIDASKRYIILEFRDTSTGLATIYPPDHND